MRRVPGATTITARRRPRAPPAAVLVELDAEGEMTGVGYLVLGPEMLIGRGASCAVQIDNSDVSREHARIVASAGAHILTDLQSKNGTAVNGKRIGEHALQHGDLVRVGGLMWRYLEDDGQWVAAGTKFRGAAVVREGMVTAERPRRSRRANPR
jgi:hypothetical protein